MGIKDLDKVFYGRVLNTGRTAYRQQAKVWHPVKDSVGIVFFGILAENDEWTDIADFVADEREVLGKYLELPHGILSHDTIQRVFLSCIRMNCKACWSRQTHE